VSEETASPPDEPWVGKVRRPNLGRVLPVILLGQIARVASGISPLLEPICEFAQAEDTPWESPEDWRAAGFLGR
jgi:hypothetical protein